MKRILLSLSFLALLTAGKAQVTPATVIGGPPPTPVDEKLLVLKESEFDFGKIPQGKPVTHIFALTNNTTADTLKISNVAASCGCTTPEWEKDKPVLPGKGTNITVGYNAAAEGPFTKQITITYNNGQVKVMTIRGEVWRTPASSAPENKGINDLKN